MWITPPKGAGGPHARGQTKGLLMAAKFEVRREGEGNRQFRVQLRGDDGTVLADLGRFPSIDAVKTGIANLRECAALGLVVDLTRAA